MNKKIKPNISLKHPETKEESVLESYLKMNYFIIILYVLVQLFPRLDVLDVMGSQWLYLSILNSFTTLYLLINKQLFPSRIFKFLFLILYLTFLLISAISFFISYNVVESLVVYSRLIISFIAFLNLITIFYHDKKSLRLLFILFGLLILYQSLYVIFTFMSNYGSNANLDEIIFQVTGNSGHKNILAASIAIKIPFLIYLIYTSKFYSKSLWLGTFLMSCIALFIINARSAYIALFLEMFIYFILVSIQYFKSKREIKELVIPASVIAIFVVSVIISQVTLSSISEQKNKKYYGSITSRIESIGFSEIGSSKRSYIWNAAIDYIKKHPIIGGGIGNWKINSIPYENALQPGFGIMKHAHNDFLEVATETGIPGALIYLALFICLGIYSLKIIASPKASLDTKMIIVAVMMALSAYGIDAMFNFPMERPNIQLLLAVIMAIIVLKYFKNASEAATFELNKKVVWVLLLCSFSTVYFSYEVFKSMQVQYTVSDVWVNTNKQEWFKSQQALLPFNVDDINAQFPAIPNISEYGMPIACMKAKFLFDEKKYDAAIALLDADKNSNPNLYYAEYLRGLIADKKNQPDTAMKYAKYIFYKRPANINFYYLIEGLAYERKDTLAMDSAFKEMIKYNYSHQLWADYSQNVFTITGNPLSAKKVVEDGLIKYPADSELLFKKNFYEGVSYYMQNKFGLAIKAFEEDLKYKDDILSKQNIAFALFNQGLYSEALPRFNEFIGKVQSGGKLEFFRGICYQQTGKKEEACNDLLKAKSLGYRVDLALIKDCH